MKLDTSKFAQAIGLAFGAAWIVCSVMVAAMPGTMAVITGHMIHADLSQFEWEMGFLPVLIGLVAWTLLSAAVGWLAATFYNTLGSDDAQG